ncbi:MAG: tetratricopeptide repeat protein [Planctomycetota bacterium JB042]
MPNRDTKRWVAWGSAGVISASLLFAGFVHEPRPSVETLFASAEFELRVGLEDEARPKLEEVLERRPDHAYAHLLMGYLERKGGAYEAALAHYLAGEALVREVENPELLGDWLVTVAELHLSTGDFEEARSFAERILDQDHRRAAGFLIRGFSRLGAGADTAFRQDLERAYRTDPADPFFRERSEFVTGAIPWAAAFTIGAGRGSRP